MPQVDQPMCHRAPPSRWGFFVRLNSVKLFSYPGSFSHLRRFSDACVQFPGSVWLFLGWQTPPEGFWRPRETLQEVSWLKSPSVATADHGEHRIEYHGSFLVGRSAGRFARTSRYRGAEQNRRIHLTTGRMANQASGKLGTGLLAIRDYQQ